MTREELLGLLMPFVCVAVICSAGRFLAPKRWRTLIAPAVGGLAVGLAVAVGFAAGFELPGFPPHARWQWLFWLAIAAGVLGCAGLMWSSHERWTALLASIAWACGVAAALRFDWIESALAAAIGVGAWTLAAQSLLVLPKSMREQTLPLVVLTLCSAAAAPVLFMSGQARFAQLAASLMVALATITVGTALWRGEASAVERLRSAAMWTGIAILFAIAYVGWAYSEADAAGHVEYVLLAIAPLAAWVAHAPRVAGRPTWQRWTATMLVVGALLAIATWLAWWSYPKPGDSPYEGMY